MFIQNNLSVYKKSIKVKAILEVMIKYWYNYCNQIKRCRNMTTCVLAKFLINHSHF